MSSVSASSADGLTMTWAFVRRNIEKIRGMIQKASPSLMDAVIQISTSGFCTIERALEVEKFFQEHSFPQNKRKIEQVLEEIKANAAFMDRMRSSDVVKPEFWSDLK